MAVAIISDLNVLFSTCRVISEPGKICTLSFIIFKLFNNIAWSIVSKALHISMKTPSV